MHACETDQFVLIKKKKPALGANIFLYFCNKIKLFKNQSFDNK